MDMWPTFRAPCCYRCCSGAVRLRRWETETGRSGESLRSHSKYKWSLMVWSARCRNPCINERGGCWLVVEKGFVQVEGRLSIKFYCATRRSSALGRRMFSPVSFKEVMAKLDDCDAVRYSFVNPQITKKQGWCAWVLWRLHENDMSGEADWENTTNAQRGKGIERWKQVCKRLENFNLVFIVLLQVWKVLPLRFTGSFLGGLLNILQYIG